MEMKSEASWQKQEQGLKAAGVLAEFANLDQDGAEGFIKAHPDFVPPVWWTGTAWKDGLGKYTPWIRERDLLRKAWSAGFPADTTLELATNSLFLAAHALASDTTAEMETTPRKIWPYQRAVLFLHVNPTKARICEWGDCGRRFVSETKGQFCRFGLVVDGIKTTCFLEHRKREKATSWSENRNRVNEQRRQEYKRAKRKRKA
jgi:hypothetical protein